MARRRSVLGLVVSALLASLLAVAGVGNASGSRLDVDNVDVRLQNGSPAIDSITPNSGSVSGGTTVTISASGLADLTAATPTVSIAGVALPAASVSALNSTTLQVTTAASANLAVGAVTVEISDGASTAVAPSGFTYRPVLETPRLSGFGDYGVTDSDGAEQLVLGALASRTQGKEVTTTNTPPVNTVVGTDSRSNQVYTFETDAPYWDLDDDNDGEEGWASEGTETSGSDVELYSYTSTTGTVGGRDNILVLESEADCGAANPSFNNINPVTGRVSYCSVFGPEVYSEPFYATSAQALSFEWGAQAEGDDYEVYAFLVRVDQGGSIPSKAQALAAQSTAAVGFHSLVMYGRGMGAEEAEDVQFITSTGDVPTDGYYRFRFVNGSYDASGGRYLGATMNIDPVIVVGLQNAITFAPITDQVAPSPVVLTRTVTATSGQPVSVISLNNACVASIAGTTLTVTTAATGTTCTLRATQGPVGQFAAAATVTRSFLVLGAADVPGAPTITGITGTSGGFTVNFIAGSTGGSEITGYEYTTDDGDTWTSIGGSQTSTPLTITGLAASTLFNVRIRALNSVGSGAASNQLSGTTQAAAAFSPPPPPPSSASTTTPSTTTVPPSTTTPPATTRPPSTTVPSATSVPAPVPTGGGVLPVLAPGVSQVLENGVAAPVEVFVQDSTQLVLRGQGFELNLAGECSFGCTIRTDSEGRQVLELEENGLARVTGEGFLPGTPVYVWLFSEPTFLGELTVNADGTFAGSVSLAGVEVGDHTLQVNGTSFDGKLRTANLGVLVAPEGVPTPLPGVLPATGGDTGPLVWVMMLTALGVALVWMSRRRTVPTQR